MTPTPEEQVERLPSVLRVLYLLFNEGYAGPARDDGQRVEFEVGQGPKGPQAERVRLV